MEKLERMNLLDPYQRGAARANARKTLVDEFLSLYLKAASRANDHCALTYAILPHPKYNRFYMPMMSLHNQLSKIIDHRPRHIIPISLLDSEDVRLEWENLHKTPHNLAPDNGDRIHVRPVAIKTLLSMVRDRAEKAKKDGSFQMAQSYQEGNFAQLKRNISGKRLDNIHKKYNKSASSLKKYARHKKWLDKACARSAMYVLDSDAWGK